MHQGIKFRCEKCPFETNRKEQLQKHVKCKRDWTFHMRKQTKCGQCPYIGPSHTDVMEHIRLKHTQKNICCLQCPRKFNKVTKLQAHVHLKHLLFMCDVCEKKFKNRRTLKKHGRLHRNVISKYDSALKAQKLYFANQARLLGIDPVCCDVGQCDYKANNMPALKLHKIISHSIRKFEKQKKEKVIVKSLQCDEGQCEYKTTLVCPRNALKMHKLRIHCRGKFKMCDQCDFKTADTARLKEHKLAVHEGIIFICDLCDYQGNKLRLLQEHTNRKHLI